MADRKYKISANIALDGDKAFKDSLKNINTEMQALGAEMKNVKTRFADSADGLKSLNGQYKVVSEQVSAQKEKVQLLREQLEKTKKEYGENSEKAIKMGTSLKNAETDLEKMTNEMKDLRKQTSGIDQVKNAFKDLKSHISGVGDKLKSIGSGVKNMAGIAAGAVGTAAGAALGVVKEVTDKAGEISDASKRVGTSAEEYQKWTYAAKLSGIEAEKMEKLMIKQQKSFSDASEGSKTASAAYQRLGIDISKMTSEQGFNTVVDKLAGMKDITERNALANDIFGKSYADLAPLLAEGSSGINALKQEASDLGGVMSNEAVAKGEELGDMLDKLKTAGGGLVASLGTALMPIIQTVADIILDNMPMLQKIIDEIAPVLSDMLNQLLPPLLDLAMSILPPIVDLIEILLPPLTDMITGLLPLVEGIINGIVSVVSGLVNFFVNSVIPFFKTTFVETWSGIWDKICSVVSNIGESIKNAFKAAINWVISGLNVFVRGINKIQIPDWVPGIGGRGFHLKEIPKLRVGIDYVPTDDYLAYLHKGERVLTAEQNKAYSTGAGGVTVNIGTFVNNRADDIDTLVNAISSKLDAQIRRKAVTA